MLLKALLEGMAIGMFVQAISVLPALILYSMKYRPFYYYLAKISVYVISLMVLGLCLLRAWEIMYIFALIGALLAVLSGLFLRWLSLERVIE
ncbi:hypothetical protein L1O03_10020 [Corynebacterium uropygiale]|uniref:Uncharacterized protein n=1 Tax=Corynebacterium uropygiale TaxID=1775911 RepID=A0A9X1QU01_9CORY|nr:hypothetical protein [Corynebacterium uropygiale]MCF4007499.1 hypothetical protein [Corynebacterium uropygiale]